jgi:glucose/arabinose dehydrogenase
MPFFDERGMLGLAFHPDYVNNGRFFVYYSAPLREEAPDDYNVTSTISEFQVSADPNRADPASERILLQVDKPQFNHNAGTILFGPDDGYLYISIGDGGGADDDDLGHVADWYDVNGGGNGQDVEENLLGNILRIDVDNGDPYGIPADNPFVRSAGFDEIYAYGLRNPYRMSFDMGGSHMLLASDAGQNLWEEVDVITKGGNYGWNVKEGTHCFSTANPDESLPDCPGTVGGDHPDAGAPLIDPAIEYANHHQPGGIGAVVVGGYVYRGDDIPQFRGRYIFGDWSAHFEEPDGTVLLAQMRKKRLWQIHEILFQDRPDGHLGEYVLAFGQNSAGEVYILTSEMTGPTGNTGKVYRLLPPGNR